jgi:hypothetical protein
MKLALQPFQIKNKIPEWQMIFEEIVSLKYGDVITDEELGNILGRKFTEARSPIYRAKRELELYHQKTLIRVINVGYKIASNINEHIGLSSLHEKKAERQIKKSQLALSSANRQLCESKEERQRLDALELHVSRLYEQHRRTRKDVTSIKKGVKIIEAKTDNLDTKIDTKVESIESRLELIFEKLKEHNIEI